jgi:adenosine deaminase
MPDLVTALPKAELHVHIEGTLEPQMMFSQAARNGVALPFASVEAVRAAYEFTDLQSFLDIYYRGAAVLLTPRDFEDLMWAYLVRAASDGVRHSEIFFDPQTHTERGIGFPVFMAGFAEAQERARRDLGITSRLIMCFLRHLGEPAALDTLQAAAPFFDQLVGVGLDSTEVGHPPAQFQQVMGHAREAGLHVVAHAGEEGPPSMSGRPWTFSGRNGSTTVCEPRGTRRWWHASPRMGFRSPCARCPTSVCGASPASKTTTSNAFSIAA